MNPLLSPRVLFTVAVGAGLLAVSFPASAQSEPTAATPTSPSDPAPAATTDGADAAPAASATAEASASTAVKRNFEATAKTDAEATSAPSPANPVEMAPNTWRCGGAGTRAINQEFVIALLYDEDRGGYNMFLRLPRARYRLRRLDFRDNPTTPSESYATCAAARRRSVAAPRLRRHWLLLEATGQVVAWLRDRPGSYYQVNVDDVWPNSGIQAATGTNWNFQVGVS